jgi:putative transposase
MADWATRSLRGMNESGRRHPIHLPPSGSAGRASIVFVTICTKDRKPLLATDVVHSLVREAWGDSSRWILGRYVILPDHLHFFCTEAPENQTPLQNWIAYWKSSVSRKWHEITGDKVSLWERHFWDRELRSSESYNQKWDYVRNNPVRHGHCQKADEWPFQGEIHELIW